MVSKKSWIGIAILVILVVTLAILFSKYPRFTHKRPPTQIGGQIPLRQKNSNSVKQVSNKDHPQLFYADLEYDPKTDVVTQLRTGKTNGDVPFLLPNPPASSSAKFVFEIEVISDKKELVLHGWKILYKEIMSTPRNTLKFTVEAPYKPNSLIKVYLPDNKLIWTGKINE